MKDIERYYNNTQSEKPRNTVQYFINEIKCNVGQAIELGCGAGNDTVFLIKNGWKVLSIDRENVEKRIAERLNEDQLQQFKFSNQTFENIKLEKNNLIVANYSLPFCSKEKFEELWAKIEDSIIKDGYFVGNFFGVNDEWTKTKQEMTFLTKDEILKLFNKFEIICFKETEKDGITGLGKEKHWHIFDVIAKKN